MSETGRAILLAIGGGIAAYKSAFLCSRLVQYGYDVRVVMTQSATRVHRNGDVRGVVGQAGRREVVRPRRIRWVRISNWPTRSI